MIPKDFREFIELLNAHDVRYVVVGGYAVAFHGHPRMTGDIDFLVEVSEVNAHRLELVLVEFGFESFKLSAAEFLQANRVIQLGNAPVRIDIITSITGVSFAEAWTDHVEGEVDGLRVNMISLENLLRNKRASGRPRDLDDLEHLT